VSDKTVTIIGVGDMGIALAATALDAGYEVTLWNRSPGRLDPFRDGAARIAGSPAEAVAASAVTIVMLADHDSAWEVMDTEAVRDVAGGRVIINLMSGDTDLARAFEGWVVERGSRYLDGRIGCYPSDIATERSAMIYGGDAEAFAACEPLLRAFASRAQYVGPDVNAPNVLAAAMFSVYHHAVNLPYYEAIAYVARHGVSPADCLPLAQQQLEIAAAAIERGTKLCLADDYAGDQASLNTHLRALRRSQVALDEVRAPHPITDGMTDCVAEAVATGRGSQQLAGVFAYLRDKPD
jgi:3-hydroxyisobutyrate dehydrogenase-like beta-hydroxyacid dehydrogenase